MGAGAFALVDRRTKNDYFIPHHTALVAKARVNEPSLSSGRKHLADRNVPEEPCLFGLSRDKFRRIQALKAVIRGKNLIQISLRQEFPEIGSQVLIVFLVHLMLRMPHVPGVMGKILRMDSEERLQGRFPGLYRVVVLEDSDGRLDQVRTAIPGRFAIFHLGTGQ